MLLFYSGLGGLTVFREIVKQRPDLHYLYLADDARFPYGALAGDEEIARVCEVVGAAIAREHPDCVVIACNTASTLVLPHLRAAHALPFVGTVPAIKPAAALSRTRRIAVLATPGTVRRDYTHELIAASRPAAASISSARRDSQLLPRLSFRGHTSPIMKSRRDRALLSRRRRRRDRCRGARLHALLASQGAFRETRTLARDLARPGSGHRASRRIAPCRSPAVARRFGAVRRQHRLHIGARPRARACCGAAPICARDGAPVSGRLLTLSTEERLRAGRAGRAGGPNGRLRF